MNRTIIGYEFLLDFGRGETTWTQLHGRGGAYGNGALHVRDVTAIPRVRDELLRRARTELKREGTVRLSMKHNEPLKIEPVECRRILDCRPIWESSGG